MASLPLVASPIDLPALLAIGLGTGAATLFGGALAFRLQAFVGLIQGFGAGVALGVALFDLLPEALNLAGGAHRPLAVATALACGFAGYLAMDRVNLALNREGPARAHFGPAALAGHSLMDGLGVGLAFQVSTSAGLILAFAVLAHDFLDGANTVTLSLAGGGGRRTARVWLAVDAAAPLVGIGLSRLLVVPGPTLALLLAVFCGFFLYIGASELLPKALARRPQASTAVATLLGLALVLGVVRLSGG